MASPTTNLNLSYPGHGAAINSWDTPLNADWEILDAALGNTLSVTEALYGSTVTLNASTTAPSIINHRISVSGALTGNMTIVFPVTVGGQWVIYNNTTGSFTLSAKVSGSAVTAIGITQTLSKIVSSNGTDLFDDVTSNTNTWTGATYAGSDVSPAAVATDQNDYNPTSLSTATCLRLNITAACSITGLQGGAAGRDLELVNIGTATAKFPANSASSSAANRFANTFNLAPLQSIFLRYDATSNLWRPKNIATAVSSCAMASVSNDLLITNIITPNTVLNITAGESVLIDSSGNGIKFENISVAVDSTTTGVGGCDVGTRAASTSYFIYLVSDGTNINAMVSTSATSPSTANAANYIYFKRIGWNRTNASSNFQRIRIMARRGQYVVSSATTTNLPIMVSAGAAVGSLTVPTWVAFSISTYVPSTATEIIVAFANGAQNVAAMLAPNNLYGAAASTSNPPPMAFSIGASTAQVYNGSFIIESTNLYWATSGTSPFVACLGWVDNI